MSTTALTHSHSHTTHSDEELGNGGEGNHTPPPTYKMVEVIAPPDYSDALQDVLVSQSKPGPTEEGGEPQGHTGEDSAMVNVPLDENEVSNMYCA